MHFGVPAYQPPPHTEQAKGKKGTPGSRNNPAEAEEDSDSDAWTIRADTPDEEFIASDDDDLDRRMIPGTARGTCLT